jgi:BirA family biotin operon repressor/biotin-[acetyl-CoA-carboxylase] ligase
MQLDPVAIAAGVRLEALGTIGSTNKEARLRAERGECGPLWITAQAQTEGRGRMERTWISPAGNLYASLLLTDPSPFERAPELAFVTVLALRDAIAAEAPVLAPHLRVKWPNDLLLAGQKCAGILIEGEMTAADENGAERHFSVVVGIGVNCASHPATASGSHAGPHTKPQFDRPSAIVSFPATDLAAHGACVAPPPLFRRLSATMCRRIAEWDGGRGFAQTLDDWLAVAHGLGEPVIVRDGGGEKRGRFVGLDRSGRLILEADGGGTEKISAGDVFPFSVRDGRRVPGHVG